MGIFIFEVRDFEIQGHQHSTEDVYFVRMGGENRKNHAKRVFPKNDASSDADRFDSMESGEETLCFIKTSKDGICPGGYYKLLTFYRKGDFLEDEFPTAYVLNGATLKQGLLGSLYGGSLEEHKRRASETGFYELITQHGYGKWRLVDQGVIGKWWKLPKMAGA